MPRPMSAPISTSRRSRMRPQRAGFALGLPPHAALLPRNSWIALIALIIAMGIVMPVSALVLPETSAFHLSAYAMTLVGKLMCYAIGALAPDLVWGYCGILSLGHALFFVLGGYAMGMYLMRHRPSRHVSERSAGLHGVSRLAQASVVLGRHRTSLVCARRTGAERARVDVRFLHVPFAREGGVSVDPSRRR